MRSQRVKCQSHLGGKGSRDNEEDVMNCCDIREGVRACEVCDCVGCMHYIKSDKIIGLYNFKMADIESFSRSKYSLCFKHATLRTNQAVMC